MEEQGECSAFVQGRCNQAPAAVLRVVLDLSHDATGRDVRDGSKEVDIAIELVATSSLAEGQHDTQAAGQGNAAAEEAPLEVQLPALGGSPSRSEKVGSTGTPPKGPERLVLRHLQAPDAPQQQQQQQQHASYSQKVTTSAAALVPGNKRQKVQQMGHKLSRQERRSAADEKLPQVKLWRGRKQAQDKHP